MPCRPGFRTPMMWLGRMMWPRRIRGPPRRTSDMATKPIVAGTDGSEESLRAVDWAAREAALRGAPLRIVGTAEVLPRMSQRTGAHGGTYEDVTDVLLEDRNRALAAAAERA